MKMRELINLAESLADPLSDPRFQFHLSVEPDLVPGKSFAEQTRTVSFAGERGDSGGTNGDIYTTRNLRYWATQFFYEENGQYPETVYLVFVREGCEGSVWAAHQDASQPEDVIVLSKVGQIDAESDDVPNYSRMEWNARKWLKEHGDEVLGTHPIREDVGETITPADLVAWVRSAHHKGDDFTEGDLESRIWKFTSYSLETVPVASLYAPWFSDDERVEEYAERIRLGEEPPPIIYDMDEDVTIDGTHRIAATKLAGKDTIRAYVGHTENIDPEWCPSDE